MLSEECFEGRDMLNCDILYKEKLYLVALSGGADSVALLLMMLDKGYSVEAVHCNFHLRGEEADRDEAFVIDLCERNGVKLHRVHFDTRGYAELHKQSIETAARNLRYGYFERLRHDIGAEAIVVAHHRDDNVETVLMNLVRGTGLNGMAGIRAVNGHVLRPLLGISRSDIETYLRRKGQTYVTDSTNLETDATRNKFRLEVMPQLCSINPNAPRGIDTTARHLQEAEKMVRWAVDQLSHETVTVGNDGIDVISVDKLLSSPSPEYLLVEIIGRYGFTPQQAVVVMRMMKGGMKGKAVQSPTHEIACEPHRLLVGRIAERPKPLSMPMEGVYVYGERRVRVERQERGSEGFTIVKSAAVAMLDASKLDFPLTMRPWCEGDRFSPFGMKGSKLVSDYLTDRKKNYFQRRGQLVVEDARGEIIWLVGERTSEKCRVGEKTSAIIVVKEE